MSGLIRKDVGKFRVADFLKEHSGAYSNVKAMKSTRPVGSGRSHGEMEAATKPPSLDIYRTLCGFSCCVVNC